jgi:hypothetical protein
MLQGANMMFKGGMNAFQKVADDLDQVKRNKAVEQLLSTVDMSDPYRGQQSAISGLLGIRGVDPKTAVMVGTGIADPYIEKRKQDALEDYRNRSLGIQYLNATKTTPKGYGMVTDEYGTTYVYNKDTGDYTPIKGDGSRLGVSPKNIVLKTVTSRDANGVETTVQVPYNKLTGEPVYGTSIGGVKAKDNNGSVVANQNGAAGVKYPTMDKSTKEQKESLQSSWNLIDSINVPTPEQSGPIDSRWDDAMAWLNVDTKDAVAAKQFDQEVANLATAFGTAQVKGVLSDKDMKFIEQQLPSREYSPEVNANRINSIKNKIKEAIGRFNSMNPYNPIDINTTATDKPKGSRYGTGTEIISF